MNKYPLLDSAQRDFRFAWQELVLTDIVYKVIALMVLTPLVGILFRVLIAASGRSVLADQDILLFFLGPVGWLCFIAVGGSWLAIIALEQAALMGIVAAAEGRQQMGVLDSLRFATANARPVALVTARLLALTLLTVAPFLVVTGLLYTALLGQHDINFYLKEKPPVFWVAVGLAGVIVGCLVAVLLRLLAGWLFALPLVLFEGVKPSRALRVSRERAKGHYRTLLQWIVGWALASLALSALASSAVIWLGRLLVPRATGSLSWMVVVLGAMLILWAGVNLIVNLLSTTTFATLLLSLYRQLGSQDQLDFSPLRIAVPTGSEVRLKLTRTRLLAISMVGVVLAIGIGAAAVRSVRLEDHTQVTAHRGSSAAAPENTMAAIELAIKDGTDWVEIDVQETADGEVVVFHDSDFKRLAGKALKIWDATMADLKEIDVGSWFAPDFKDQRVPTLGQVLDACKGKVNVNIELKYYGHDQQLEQRVAGIVEAHGMTPNVVIMSLKVDAVEKMRSIRPGWKVGLLMSVSAGDLKNLDADFLAVNAGFVDRRFVRSTHGLDKQVFVWTVNDAPTMSTMIGRGVDSLITDKPALARSVLAQRAKLSAPERLLLELAGTFGVASEIGEP